MKFFFDSATICCRRRRSSVSACSSFATSAGLSDATADKATPRSNFPSSSSMLDCARASSVRGIAGGSGTGTGTVADAETGMGGGGGGTAEGNETEAEGVESPELGDSGRGGGGGGGGGGREGIVGKTGSITGVRPVGLGPAGTLALGNDCMGVCKPACGGRGGGGGGANGTNPEPESCWARCRTVLFGCAAAEGLLVSSIFYINLCNRKSYDF